MSILELAIDSTQQNAGDSMLSKAINVGSTILFFLLFEYLTSEAQ
jgi:hypothetical protein